MAFYCSNANKRPRPKWDDEDESEGDGLIGAHCTHGGAMNRTMNPALWDRCRSRCPAAKPQPPVAPGAQLTLQGEVDKVRMGMGPFINDVLAGGGDDPRLDDTWTWDHAT